MSFARMSYIWFGEGLFYNRLHRSVEVCVYIIHFNISFVDLSLGCFYCCYFRYMDASLDKDLLLVICGNIAAKPMFCPSLFYQFVQVQFFYVRFSECFKKYFFYVYSCWWFPLKVGIRTSGSLLVTFVLYVPPFQPSQETLIVCQPFYFHLICVFFSHLE